MRSFFQLGSNSSKHTHTHHTHTSHTHTHTHRKLSNTFRSDKTCIKSATSKCDRQKHRAVMHEKKSVLENLTELDMEVLMNAEDEFSRRGGKPCV